MADSLVDRIARALRIAEDCAMFDGDHHKMWVIDQMVRELTGDKYDQWVRDYQSDDGPDTYEWDEGVAP